LLAENLNVCENKYCISYSTSNYCQLLLADIFFIPDSVPTINPTCVDMSPDMFIHFATEGADLLLGLLVVLEMLLQLFNIGQGLAADITGEHNMGPNPKRQIKPCKFGQISLESG
jgi:hypothetical protein